MSHEQEDEQKDKGVWVTNDQVQLCGSPNVARFLAQCLYWSDREIVKQRQGWFYKSRQEWKAETWLSRYQQEKARKQLRGMGLLKEERERTNIGIKLWFRVDKALLNVLLNQLAKSEENSDEVNDRAGSNETDRLLSDRLVNCKEVDESKCVEEIETEVQEKEGVTSDIAEISTIVSNNIDTTALDTSDIYCVDNDDKKEAAAPSLSNLSNQSDSIQYCEDPDVYQTCHPFIYQFMNTRVLSGHPNCIGAYKAFCIGGLRHRLLQDAMLAFIEEHGHSMLTWYRENTPVPVNPLSADDLTFAILVSEGGAA